MIMCLTDWIEYAEHALEPHLNVDVYNQFLKNFISCPWLLPKIVWNFVKPIVLQIDVCQVTSLLCFPQWVLLLWLRVGF